MEFKTTQPSRLSLYLVLREDEASQFDTSMAECGRGTAERGLHSHRTVSVSLPFISDRTHVEFWFEIQLFHADILLIELVGQSQES